MSRKYRENIEDIETGNVSGGSRNAIWSSPSLRLRKEPIRRISEAACQLCLAFVPKGVFHADAHYDANAFFTESAQEPVRRAPFGQSLSISHPFFKNLIVAEEI
jgi:hypothetical protein